MQQSFFSLSADMTINAACYATLKPQIPLSEEHFVADKCKTTVLDRHTQNKLSIVTHDWTFLYIAVYVIHLNSRPLMTDVEDCY